MNIGHAVGMGSTLPCERDFSRHGMQVSRHCARHVHACGCVVRDRCTPWLRFIGFYSNREQLDITMRTIVTNII